MTLRHSVLAGPPVQARLGIHGDSETGRGSSLARVFFEGPIAEVRPPAR